MLFNYLTLLLFSVHIQADGEFSVLHTPPSMTWIGEHQLDSFYLSDVLLATLGHTVSGSSDWSGLAIVNPFALGSTSMIIVHIEGIYRLALSKALKVYDLFESDTVDSIDHFIDELDPSNVYDLNFINHTLGVEKYKHYFGNVSVPITTPMQHFKPDEYENHRQFLEEIGYMHAISENLTHLLRSSQVIVIRISLHNIIKINKYSLLYEAKKMINDANFRLLTAARSITNSLLFLQTTDRKSIADIYERTARKANNTNPFGKFHNRNYPIIFNIILWFCLLMLLALCVVCYVIATIDPGRDSVLYRVNRKLAYRSNKKRN